MARDRLVGSDGTLGGQEHWLVGASHGDRSAEGRGVSVGGCWAAVSVVTAARNAGHTIEGCVRCVADQTLPVMEHIVIDDGSSDDTAGVVRRLQKEYEHLVYLYQAPSGTGAARNRGIAYASARYIAFLDSDDWWTPDKVAQQVGFMQRTGAVFTYGCYDKRDPCTGTLYGRIDCPEQVGYQDLLGACPVGCLTAAYDQQILGKFYMPDVQRGQDWGLWLAITRRGVVGHKYPGNHAVYHDGDGTLSSNKARKAVDVFRIYYQEERLGLVRSLYYLARHVENALRKREVLPDDGKTPHETGS